MKGRLLMERIINKVDSFIPTIPKKKRVAAYARVSSDKDAMLKSLSAQVSYYSELIQHNPVWEYVGVYSDEGLTGTKDDRTEFQRLLTDCRSGMIDMVITKAISRFARNTVTLLETVRELKSIGVDVFFEKENIHSMSGDGELLLTILASFAQAESLSVSENCKWRIRNKFKEGELANLRFMYGYRINKDDIEIDEEQAGIVRMIFNDYLNGEGCTVIAKKLRELNIPCQNWGVWSHRKVADIIQNEKYTGNAILQKKFVTDHLSKKRIRNRGQLPSYYAQGTHDGIIDEETFSKAQLIITDRKDKNAAKNNINARYPFSGMIRCGNCGKSYKRKITHGKALWNCSTYLELGKSKCQAKKIDEETLLLLTAEVLGLAEFDETIFKGQIAEMVILSPNKIIYRFRDGHEIETEWQDNSRRNSWTEEMKQAARERENNK